MLQSMNEPEKNMNYTEQLDINSFLFNDCSINLPEAT